MSQSGLEQLGDALRQFRRSAGLTQAEVATRTRIHRQTISDIERGKFLGSIATLQRYLLLANLELSCQTKSSGFPQLEELQARYQSDPE